MTPEVIAQHMGYKGVSGTSLRMIASLRQYGILDGRGDDIRLSEDVITVFADEEIDSKDRADALNRLLKNPPLFQEVMSEFPRTPSAPNLKAYMARRKFSPKAAGTFAEVFRDSVEFVESESSAYNQDDSDVTQENVVHQVVTRDSINTRNPITAVPESGGLTEIEYVRVSKRLGIRLMADGPFTKKDMEIFSKRIASAIEDGVYDDLDEDGEESESDLV